MPRLFDRKGADVTVPWTGGEKASANGSGTLRSDDSLRGIKGNIPSLSPANRQGGTVSVGLLAED